MTFERFLVYAVAVFVVSVVAGMLWGCESNIGAIAACSPCELHLKTSDGTALCRCVEYKVVKIPAERKVK